MGATRSKEEWAEIVNDYKQSGKSLREYSEASGIKLKTLSNHTRNDTSLKSTADCQRRNLDDWTELIRDQIASGLSVSVWCKEKGVSQSAMRIAERKIRTAENQKHQNWAQVQIATEVKAPEPSDGLLRIKFSDIEIEADGSYSAQNIVTLVSGLRQL